MFESLENRQLMSATLLNQTALTAPTTTTVTYAELSPEQAAKAAASTTTSTPTTGWGGDIYDVLLNLRFYTR